MTSVWGPKLVTRLGHLTALGYVMTVETRDESTPDESTEVSGYDLTFAPFSPDVVSQQPEAQPPKK